MGRRSKYDPALAQRVLDAMLEGMTTKDACRHVGVKRSTFRGWANADRGGLAARYMRAQEMQMDIWNDELLEIVDFSPASCDQIERQMYLLHARCEKIRARHERVEAAAREKQRAVFLENVHRVIEPLSNADAAAFIADLQRMLREKPYADVVAFVAKLRQVSEQSGGSPPREIV